jgi:hypothetical protein
MPDPRLSVHDRVGWLHWLNWAAWQLNRAGARLGDAGCETESDMIEQAARSVLAACWLLERPIRPQLPPQQWRDGTQTAQSQPYQAYPQASEPPRQM